MRYRNRRRGFTLVELLIVIIIIGILAGVMFPVVGKARAKARATRVVSNMKTIQKAAMMYFADHGEWFPDSASDSNPGKKDAGSFLLPYLQGEMAGKFDDVKQYFVWFQEESGGDKKFYVVCKVDNRFEDFETRKALQRMCPDPPYFNADGEGHSFEAKADPGTGYSGNTQLTLLIVDRTFASK